MVEPDRPQMTIWRKRITCWIPEVTNTYSEYIIISAFPLQHWLHESASLLRYTCTACLVLLEITCVYYAVRAACLITVPANLNKVALRQVLLWVIRFSPPGIIPPASRIHRRRRLRVALPKRQTGEACEPSKEQCCFGNRRALDRRVISLSSLNG